MSDENNQLTIIDNSIEVFKGGSAILHKNQDRALAATTQARKLIELWESAFAETDPSVKATMLAELDAKSNTFLVKCRDVKAKMNEERMPITSLMDEIKTMFTTAENALDMTKQGDVYRLQVKRNEYSAWDKQQRAIAAEAAEKKRKKDEEAIELRAALNKYVAEILVKTLSDKKQKVTAAFNAITLETYVQKSGALKNMPTSFKRDELSIVLPTLRHLYHTQAEVEEIRNSVKATYDFESFYTEYETAMQEYKQELIDKLPSKKAELDEQERLRLQAIKDKEELEKKLKAQKDAAERERLKQEAEQKQRDLEAAQKRLEDEKRLREQEEELKIERERQEKLKEAENVIEANKSADTAAAMFNESLANSGSGSSPSSKDRYEVTVLNVAGWVLLFEFWFRNEGKDVKPEEAMDLDSKKFESLRKFAAKQALKGKKIDSPHIKYEETTKARNVKERKKKESDVV